MKQHYRRFNPRIYTFAFLFILLGLSFSCSKSKEEELPPKKLTSLQKDSITIVNSKWRETAIKDGVNLKITSLPIFNSAQVIHIVEVDTAIANVVFAVTVPVDYVRTSTQAIEKNAIVAINGTYGYSNDSGKFSRHFVKVDNVVKYYTQNHEFATRATGIITVTNNFVDISYWNKDKERGKAGSAQYAIVSGPLILDDDKEVEMYDNNFVYDRHPRTFMALSKGKVILGVVDGRDQPRAYGMSLLELRFFAETMGYTDLINLDGGGSSTLYVKGYSYSGVVNRPTDATGERTVKSVFYIKNKE